jgi:hypothetical protein
MLWASIQGLCQETWLTLWLRQAQKIRIGGNIPGSSATSILAFKI